MESDKSIDEVVSNIVCDYFATYGIDNPVIPNYQIVSDIASAYLALRPDILKQSNASKEILNRYNGFAVPPEMVGGTFTVLINSNVLMENFKHNRMDWVGTIVHETTHVQDFAGYALIVGASKYEEVLQISNHGMFDLWTEIHARSNGYYFTRKYTVGEENITNENLVPDIMLREIPGQFKLLFQNYHSTKNGFDQAYYVAQYIGRLYTLQSLYPNSFNDEWISNHFGENEWMTELFLFYKKHPILKEAVEHFEEMKNILRKNFRGI